MIGIRQARKPRACTERKGHTIQRGDLYLYIACPPWHEVNDGRKWWVVSACLDCAKRSALHTNETEKQLAERTKPTVSA